MINIIRAVFFDIDNTLLSFSGYVRETMKNGFALFGLPSYRESMFTVFERINNGLWKQLEQGTLSFEELIAIRWDRIFKELDISFDGKRFEAYFREQLFSSAVLEPGAADVLEYLQKKYVLCIASNGPYEQQINRLRVGKLYDHFSRFYISEKIGASKPGREFFDFCFHDLHDNGLSDLLPEEVMIIGDSLSSDIAGGKAYGLKTCLYDPKKNTDPADTDAADHVIGDLSAVMRIL